MARFILVPGAGGVAWYWHRVVPLLEAAGHEAVAVDLPGDDERAGLAVYAERVLQAIGDREGSVLVASSLGGFTAPLVCARTDLQRLVFVNAMIPTPGETAGDWWGNTGSEAARAEAAWRGGYSEQFDLATYFLHDVPPEVIAGGESQQRPQAGCIFREPCRFEAWPQVPMHVIVGRDDRFFPPEFQRRVARERLGLPVDELPGGHLIALANPQGLVERMLTYL
ncbi:MAG TPA: alpha/beta hydrolase [Polyangiaceae bacterium]|nr:alpha/beta hydrolase [Polyangiaceae bacterium]